MNREYPFKVRKVINGNTVQGILDLGFGIKLHRVVTLAGLKVPSPRLDTSISDLKERRNQKVIGMLARKRLRDLIREGESYAEGLILEVFSEKESSCNSLEGSIKYIYARDLYNHHPTARPWVGWKHLSQQLHEEINEKNSETKKIETKKIETKKSDEV